MHDVISSSFQRSIRNKEVIQECFLKEQHNDDYCVNEHRQKKENVVPCKRFFLVELVYK